jgi:hypothetical protein
MIRKMMRSTGALALVLIAMAVSISAQSTRNSADALLDVLVWGTHMPINPDVYDVPLKLEIQQYLGRALAYRSNRPDPIDGEPAMVNDARVRYVRRLAGVSPDPSAPELAEDYVDSLRPCYEWEGFHECPEREAQFADDYQAAHPDGPFRAYLPLLAAHRWLCTAEAYEHEQRPAEANRSRLAYQSRLEVARQVKDQLIRTAAERLGVRGRCMS